MTRPAAVITLVTASLAFSAEAFAAEGDLDPSFGTGGRVATPMPVGTQPRQSGMAIDAQGRIVVIGGVRVSPTDGDMLVVRYLPDGTLDPSFEGDGIATFGSPAANFESADAVAVDAQGRILVFGVTVGANQDFALIRVNPDGTQDTAFGPAGSNGFVTADLHGQDEFAGEVALDSQQRIVIGGSTRHGDVDFGVVRYDQSGNPDTSFSGDGEQSVDFTPNPNDDDFALAMAIDDQDRIVLAGRARRSSPYDFALARLNSDGSRDASFGPPPAAPGQEGQVTTSFAAGDDRANAVTIDDQGRIIAAGATVGTRAQFAVARYNADGSLDTTFSEDGLQISEIGGVGDGDEAYFAGVDAQGRIVLVGDARAVGAREYALARYLPNGELDPAFGGDGKVTLPNGEASAAVLDAQDRIVAGGRFNPGDGGEFQFGLARFIGDAVAPPAASIESGPPDGAVINDATPTFEFATSEAGASFACGFDGSSATCASPFTPGAALPDGPHTFAVNAVDPAGNASAAATRSFTVDTIAPDIEIAGKKKVKTHKKKGKSKLRIETSEPAVLTCTVDRKAPKPCDDRFKAKLKLGKHKVTATATDQAGNSSNEAKKVKVVSKP